MNIEEYISSGVIELYVMKALSPDEMREVEKNALLHPEIKKEIMAAEKAMEQYILTYQKVPRKELKEQILQKINGEKEGSNFYKYLAAASVILFLMSTAVNVLFWEKLKYAKNEIAILTAQKDQYAEEFKQVKNELDKNYADLGILKDTNYTQVTLKGLPISPASLVNVYWNAQTGLSYIDIRNIPAPAENKQYQLWAIVDGKPVDAGMIDFGQRAGLQKMKNISGASAFAITLEPKGGSISPTLDKMVVLGKV